MAIQISEAPAGSVEQFFGAVPGVRRADLADDHRHLLPHRVYELPLAAVAQGAGVRGATFTGWRYLFVEDGRHRALEVAVLGGATHAVSTVEEGPEVDGFEDVCRWLPGHPLVAEALYEITYLRVPACGAAAIWLRGIGQPHEVVIPLEPAPVGLGIGQVYPVHRFERAVEQTAVERAAADEAHAAAPVVPDDLARIEGIGPKVVGLLHDAGITAFAALAATPPERLRTVLDAGGPSFNRADPTSWPEQAGLAAAGKWAELADLQEALRGGRLRG